VVCLDISRHRFLRVCWLDQRRLLSLSFEDKWAILRSYLLCIHYPNRFRVTCGFFCPCKDFYRVSFCTLSLIEHLSAFSDSPLCLVYVDVKATIAKAETDRERSCSVATIATKMECIYKLASVALQEAVPNTEQTRSPSYLEPLAH
jgi:hypothetical protein